VPVVVYDDWNRAGSARAWWVLTAAGLQDVRILDGGLAAWRASGGRLETGPVIPQPGNVAVPHSDLYAGALPTIDAHQCVTGDVKLLDARAPERFRGETEPVDRVAGHIPGARNVPSGSVLRSDGTFLDDDALRHLFQGIRRDDSVGAYCGSGVTATIIVAALAALGDQAALFPGSWSEWSSDADRAVARGAE
jgi:thiosulfate/3-mercaptopyruvate sulfurtransferase